MSGNKPAPLASTLLFAKGRAHPVGYDGDRPPALPPVKIEPVARPAPRYAGTRRGSNPPGDVKLSFHVDAERHRRLKLAMAHLRRTGQELVLAAVDHYLEHVVPNLVGQGCQCLAPGGAAKKEIDAGACFCAAAANPGPPS